MENSVILLCYRTSTKSEHNPCCSAGRNTAPKLFTSKYFHTRFCDKIGTQSVFLSWMKQQQICLRLNDFILKLDHKPGPREIVLLQMGEIQSGRLSPREMAMCSPSRSSRNTGQRSRRPCSRRCTPGQT